MRKDAMHHVKQVHYSPCLCDGRPDCSGAHAWRHASYPHLCSPRWFGVHTRVIEGAAVAVAAASLDEIYTRSLFVRGCCAWQGRQARHPPELRLPVGKLTSVTQSTRASSEVATQRSLILCSRCHDWGETSCRGCRSQLLLLNGGTVPHASRRQTTEPSVTLTRLHHLICSIVPYSQMFKLVNQAMWRPTM